MGKRELGTPFLVSFSYFLSALTFALTNPLLANICVQFYDSAVSSFMPGLQLLQTLKKQNAHNKSAREIGFQIGSANLKRREEKFGESHDCTNE